MKRLISHAAMVPIVARFVGCGTSGSPDAGGGEDPAVVGGGVGTNQELIQIGVNVDEDTEGHGFNL